MIKYSHRHNHRHNHNSNSNPLLFYTFSVKKSPHWVPQSMNYFGVHSGIFCAILDLSRFIGIRKPIPPVKLLNLLEKTLLQTTEIYFWGFFQKEVAGKTAGGPDFGIFRGN